MIRFILFMSFFCFSFPSSAIYNLKTNKEAQPKIGAKHWILVAQGCHSCSELLKDLKTFCKGKKPSSAQVGFFVTGSSSSVMLKKLKDFKEDYEIFSGSPNEFYESYKVMGSPSLKAKNNKVVLGKGPVLQFLKKDDQFCSS